VGDLVAECSPGCLRPWPLPAAALFLVALVAARVAGARLGPARIRLGSLGRQPGRDLVSSCSSCQRLGRTGWPTDRGGIAAAGGRIHGATAISRCPPPAGGLLPVIGLSPALAQLDRPPRPSYWDASRHAWRGCMRAPGHCRGGKRAGPPCMDLSVARELRGGPWPRRAGPVVSGLAEGIDCGVHRGCLEAGGRPACGCWGTPLESEVYPPQSPAALQAAVVHQRAAESASCCGGSGARGHSHRAQPSAGALSQPLSCCLSGPEQSGALHSRQLGPGKQGLAPLGGPRRCWKASQRR